MTLGALLAYRTHGRRDLSLIVACDNASDGTTPRVRLCADTNYVEFCLHPLAAVDIKQTSGEQRAGHGHKEVNAHIIASTVGSAPQFGNGGGGAEAPATKSVDKV